VGHYLSPFLASIAGIDVPSEIPIDSPGTLPIEIELDPEAARSGLLLAHDDGAEGERVDDFMSRNPLVVAPEDTLGEVAEKLVEQDGGVAAVAEYGRLIGILTRTDLLQAYAARAHPSEARVRQWMTAEPVTIFSGATLSAAATLMREHDITHLLVVEGERPVGSVSMGDVLSSGAALGTGIGLGF
jgi:CBS domain-containing protein